jgi:aminoglycoside 2''-phosphotransferase
MDDPTSSLQVIRRAYPDLPIHSVQPHNHEGQFNNLLIINDELVFRFPRYVDGVASILNETRILSRIQGRTSLPIPNPIYSSQGTQRVGEVLAGFLQELHAISLQTLGDDLPLQDGLSEWVNLYADIREHLFEWMRPQARDEVSFHFEDFLRDPALHSYQPALRHGDFGFGNILYDPQAMNISGVIDFGFVGLGDPAIDLASASVLGDKIYKKICQAYPNSHTMLDRARFYRGTYALQEALHGLLKDDQEAFESGIEQYR